MKYISLPDEKERRLTSVDAPTRCLSFYLAMEEFVARRLDEPDCFFMWQVEPSVIFGRNQVLENEVNLDYCKAHGIKVYRRKSGGGCVYADQDNLMWSFITSGENVGFAFNRFVNMVLLVLRKLGIAATGTSHNDIMIGNRKVCGTACYHVAGRSIVHSTMLYDTNMDHMLHAITPGPEKLEKKGIQSVRQRITLLKDYLTEDDQPKSAKELKAFIREALCDGEYVLTQADVTEIEQLEQTYLKEEFINLIQ
jgi:lipoic acid synthetase/lipoate-protein ligase A